MIVNCNWVDTRWQQYSTHLHTNSTWSNTINNLIGKGARRARLCGYFLNRKKSYSTRFCDWSYPRDYAILSRISHFHKRSTFLDRISFFHIVTALYQRCAWFLYVRPFVKKKLRAKWPPATRNRRQNGCKAREESQHNTDIGTRTHAYGCTNFPNECSSHFQILGVKTVT
jgi:hypothetical protein